MPQATDLPLMFPLGSPARLWLLPGPSRRSIVVVAVALALAGLAVAITWTSHALSATSTFLLSFGAVTAAGWFGGALGGIVATAATATLLDLLLVPPLYRLGFLNTDDAMRFATFIGLCAIATAMNWSLHNASRRLRQSEALARVVIESAPMLVTAADSLGRVIVFNAECERLTGRTAAEVLGQPLVETLVPEQWRADVIRRFDVASDADLAEPHRNPWTMADGSERLIEWRCYRLSMPSGTATFGFGYDVTERHRMESELRVSVERADAARREAAAAVAARERFIATMSHELRGPITAVSGWARLLATTAVDANTARIAERISRSGVLMQRLIGDVQDLAAIDAGKVTLRPMHVMLDEIAAGAVDAAAPLAASRGVAIQCETNGSAPVWGDADRLYQVVSNLVNNALKFTPDGGRITVSVTTADQQAELLVEDNGPGIADADTQRVFEPFWQSDHTRGGLGLGLPLVLQIAHLHGGSAGIRRARPEGGTVACVTLPLDPAPTAGSSVEQS